MKSGVSAIQGRPSFRVVRHSGESRNPHGEPEVAVQASTADALDGVEIVRNALRR